MNKQESGYRWVVFGTIILAYFVILCQRTGPGLITDQLMRDFHVSASTIGLVSSVQFLAYSGLQIPVGLVSGRYGPNLFLILGALLVGIGDLLFSLAPNEYILITSRFLTGIGDSLIFINFVLILNQWFKSKEYVGLLGIISLVASLGSLNEGLIDELSLILVPIADGSSNSVTLFETSSFLTNQHPVNFFLKDVEKLDDGGLWLRYVTKQD